MKSLYWKLALSFALVAFLTAALVAVFIRLTSADRLSQLIIDQQRTNLETALQSYYTTQGDWSGVTASWRDLQFRSIPTPNDGGPDRQPQEFRQPGSRGRENLLGLADAQGVVVVSVDPNYPPGSLLPPEKLKTGTPVMVSGQQVGTILTASQAFGFNPQEALFLRRTSQALLLAIVVAMFVALALGGILARRISHPLRLLTLAAQNITRGQLEQQVDVRSDDEVGQLADAFNRMSQEVARVNRMRRQMTADIAHDLRTPLTVISGYIESMRDEVLKPTPERFALIYSEIERLQNLVEDLRMLSLADSGELSLNLQRIPPQALLNRAADLFRHQAEQQDISLQVAAPPDLPDIRVDEARMIQVLGNLVTNSLRYTPAGGQIILSAHGSDGQVEINVQDNGEGIDPLDLPYIFDRFRRIDKSRHSEHGESGLGLSIVKALVESQGGKPTAESAPGLGTTIHLTFPAQSLTE